MSKNRTDNIVRGDDYKDAVSYVVTNIDDVVGNTIGAGGKLILAVNKFTGTPSLSKDGIHALSSISFGKTQHDLIHQIFVEGINKTAAQSGDGRTTSTLIACHLIKEGLKPFMSMTVSEMDELVDSAIAKVKAEARYISEERIPLDERYLDLGKNFDVPVGEEDDPLTDMNKNLYDIAMVSSNGDEEVSTAIACSMERVGMTGLVTADISYCSSIEVEYANGLIFHSGAKHERFLTDDENQNAVFNQPRYLIANYKLSNANELVKYFKHAVESNTPIVIMAQDYTAGFVNACLGMKMQHGVPVMLIQPYKYAERRQYWLRDMAVSLGATLFDDVTSKIPRGSVDDLGSSDKIVVKMNSTNIIGGHPKQDVLESYQRELKSKADQETSSFNREKILERLANLTGELALIKVGAESETLAKERLARCEDALNSCLQASEHGYVDGGGAALYRAGIKGPLLRILSNAGIEEGDEKYESILKLVEEGTCYDVLSGGACDNIIDSLITIVNGLNNAKGIAKAIVSASHLLDLPEVDQAKQL